MWKDSIRNIVVIFQTTILRIVGFYVRHSANDSIFLTDHSARKKENIMDIKPDRIKLKTILILISFGGFITQIGLQSKLMSGMKSRA